MFQSREGVAIGRDFTHWVDRIGRAQPGIEEQIFELRPLKTEILLEMGEDVVDRARPKRRVIAFGDDLLPSVLHD